MKSRQCIEHHVIVIRIEYAGNLFYVGDDVGVTEHHPFWGPLAAAAEQNGGCILLVNMAAVEPDQ